MPKAMQDQFDDALKAAKQVVKDEADKWKASKEIDAGSVDLESESLEVRARICLGHNWVTSRI
jgi:hypothetical protein